MLVALVASMHVDGRIRERATRLLAGHRGSVAASAVAVRLLDHVPQVRAVAGEALGGVVDAETTVPALHVALVGRDRLPGRDALAAVETHVRHLVGGDTEFVEMLLASGIRDVRRRGFVLAHAGGVLARERLLEAAQQETDQLVLAWCSDWLLELAEPADLAGLLDARAAVIRQVAVIRAADVDTCQTNA